MQARFQGQRDRQAAGWGRSASEPRRLAFTGLFSYRSRFDHDALDARIREFDVAGAQLSYPTVESRLPRSVSRVLFGDRARFGPLPDATDKSWIEWQTRSLEFYAATQGRGVGSVVNRAGYRVMQEIDLTGKRVVEIGPASLQHAAFWRGKPAHFTCIDINDGYLDIARRRLTDLGVPFDAVLLDDPARPLPLPDGAFDVALSFFSLEHIFPVRPQLREMSRILAKGGSLLGAIPCEGGLAWGMGRYMTSRRWLKRNTTIDPDRIICWEHPNFAKLVLAELEQAFDMKQLSFWPLRVPAIDVNLVAKFVCMKREGGAGAV